MEEKINGYENEFRFMHALNNKRIYEIKNLLLREFIDDLFDKPNRYNIVNCYVDTSKKKYDIVITINNKIRRISLKKGHRNSVHVEPISEFIHFLIENGIEKEAIVEYLRYHYADGSTNGSGQIRLSASEYKKSNQDKINFINKKLNSKELLIKAIDRFILKGNYSDISIDALIDGTVDDFIWLKTEDIINLITNKLNTYSSAVHFGPLTVQPMDRCLNRNPRYEKKRFCVQIKWYNIFDDIIEYQNNKIMDSFNLPRNFLIFQG